MLVVKALLLLVVLVAWCTYCSPHIIPILWWGWYICVALRRPLKVLWLSQLQRKWKLISVQNAKVVWLLQIWPHRLIWKSQNMDILPADLPLKFSAENSTVVHWYNGELIFHADNVSRFLNRTNHQKIHGYLSRFNEWCCGWFWNYFHPPSMSDLLWCEVKFSASSL